MEFELDFRDNQPTWLLLGLFLLASLLFGLAKLGQAYTPYENGVARILHWEDWELRKAEKVYAAELQMLRNDADRLAQALESKSDPVQVSLLTKEILQDVSDGTPSLLPARQALAQAALDVRDWSTGLLDRDRAIASLQVAITLLQ